MWLNLRRFMIGEVSEPGGADYLADLGVDHMVRRNHGRGYLP